MSKTLTNTFIIGFALFAMFFGAGNLIFPPTIGVESGTSWGAALLGFSMTGIVLPLLAVLAILNAGGKFEELTKPISSWFHILFNLLLMVGIGMLVTVPRMAATTHELGVEPLMPGVPSFVTVIVFFAICYIFAMDQSNVIERIGKLLTPALVMILLIIVGKGIFSPVGTPAQTEVENAFSNAFISAYQTGDVITGIFVAPIFIAAIAVLGYKGKQIRTIAISATAIAGVGLLIVYGGLLYLGAAGNRVFPSGISDTALVSELVNVVLGNFGVLALALTVGLACLTSAIGVVAVISQFLSSLTKGTLAYRSWVFIVCLTGAAMGSLGVGAIIQYTMPIFLALYPVAIVLVLLGVCRAIIPNAGSYRGAILFTFIVSLTETLGVIGLEIPGTMSIISQIPLSTSGFSWLLPAIIGFLFGTIWHQMKTKKKLNERAA
ncbi:branched-chain amino acid transport system II carrier protein [Halalkalibacter krulwichiae]|uniref:Branched-chain amino acid transport system carrier protein n=1 Tax=Halalkalibacter krulwichiae TaxID=199441 RepID=A0A1X9MKP5_9BACI|nr:branched-chain amino acid transport system II carrier protein [Halalkalibacter krulwichiae]ARK32261.1 Branched-chain amino acid transport system 2 carrier protein [Halalkalibacter krulwichiae]